MWSSCFPLGAHIVCVSGWLKSFVLCSSSHQAFTLQLSLAAVLQSCLLISWIRFVTPRRSGGGGGRKFTNLLFVESSGPFFSTVMVFSSKQLLLSGFGPGPPSSHSPDRCVASAVSRGTLGGCVRSLSARWRFFISRWNQVLAQEISCLSWFCRFPDSAASVSPRDSLPRLWCHASHTLVKPSNYWTLFLNFFIACACLTWVFTQTQQLCCQMYGWQPVVWKKAALHSLVLPFSRFIGQKNRSRSDTFFLSSSW